MLKLNIPHRLSPPVVVASLAEAQAIYKSVRDASCEGASTFPYGRITGHEKGVLSVSYNGRIWVGSAVQVCRNFPNSEEVLP